MTDSFFNHPIINSPYKEPSRYHALDSKGQPTGEPPRLGRRPSSLVSAVPKPRKLQHNELIEDQQDIDLVTDDGISTLEQEYNPTPIINDIRNQLKIWRTPPPESKFGCVASYFSPSNILAKS